MRTKEHLKEIAIPLSEKQWEELIAMSFEPFEFNYRDPLTRGQWYALCEMAYGKAIRVERGAYGDLDANGNAIDLDAWGDELRELGDAILGFLDPAD